jgi:hypothetical protein
MKEMRCMTDSVFHSKSIGEDTNRGLIMLKFIHLKNKKRDYKQLVISFFILLLIIFYLATINVFINCEAPCCNW